MCQTLRAVFGLLLRWYDRTYLRVHGLRDAAAKVGPILRVEVRRHRGPRVRLADGTEVRWGDRIGILHLFNERIAEFHRDGYHARRAGLKARRAFIDSLKELARRVLEIDRYAEVKAFTATTVMHSAARGTGFEIRPLPSQCWSQIVAAYERALVAHYHPMGRHGAARARFGQAHAIWISREALVRRYGPEAGSANPADEASSKRRRA